MPSVLLRFRSKLWVLEKVVIGTHYCKGNLSTSQFNSCPNVLLRNQRWRDARVCGVTGIMPTRYLRYGFKALNFKQPPNGSLCGCVAERRGPSYHTELQNVKSCLSLLRSFWASCQGKASPPSPDPPSVLAKGSKIFGLFSLERQFTKPRPTIRFVSHHVPPGYRTLNYPYRSKVPITVVLGKYLILGYMDPQGLRVLY